MNALIPALAVTVGPVLALAPVVWALRPQGGTRWLKPHPVPVTEILARLADEVGTGEIPRDVWGGVDRPALWTVPADGDVIWSSRATDRDMTGVFPVVRAA